MARAFRSGRMRGGLALGLAVLVVALLWAVPPMLDGARFRAGIAALGSARLGCPVTIEGAVHLRLLPHPVLSAAKVRLCDGTGPSGARLRVAGLRLGLDPWALLRGRFTVSDLLLEKPVLRLARPAAGTLSLLGAHRWQDGFAVRVRDGQLVLAGHAVRAIAATVTVSGGALVAQGSGRMAGQDWHLALRRTAGPRGALEASLTQGAAKDALALRFAGSATPGRIAGRLLAGGAGVAGQARLILDRAPDGLPRLGLEQARLQVLGAAAGHPRAGAHPGADAPQLDLTGAARLALGPGSAGLDIDLDMLRLNGLASGLPGWLAAAWHAAPARLLAVRIGVGDLVVDGVALRHLRATLRPGPDGWQPVAVAVQAPGGAGMAFTADAPGVEGNRVGVTGPGSSAVAGGLSLDAPDLSATLAGLGQPELATLLAGNAHLVGHLELGAQGLRLSGLHGQAGAARLSGAARLALGAAPALDLDLVLDRARMGPLLALGRAQGLGTALRRMAAGGVGAGRVFPGGVSLHLRVGQLGIGAARLDDLALAVSLGPSGLAVEGLSAQLGSAQLGSAHLGLAHLAAAAHLNADGSVQALALRLNAPQAAALRSLAPGWFVPRADFWQGPASLALSATGPVRAMSVRAVLVAGGGRLVLAPVLDLSHGLAGWQAAGTVMLRHPGAIRLAAMLGLTRAVGLDWLGAGSLALSGQMEAGPDHLALPQFQLSAGLLHGSGALDLRFVPGATPRLSGQIMAETLPVPVAVEDTPLPLALLHGWQASLDIHARHLVAGFRPLGRDVALRLGLGHGHLALEDIAARLGGGSLAGSAALDATVAPPRARISLSLHAAQVSAPLGPPGAPLDLIAGTMDGDATLDAAGYSLAAMRAGLAGQIDLHSENGAVAGFDLPALHQALAADPPVDPAVLRAALRSGSSGFTTLDGTARIAHGVVRIGRLRLDGPAGSARLSGSIAFVPALADLALSVQPAGAGMPIIQRLTGQPDAPLRTDNLGAVLAGR